MSRTETRCLFPIPFEPNFLDRRMARVAPFDKRGSRIAPINGPVGRLIRVCPTFSSSRQGNRCQRLPDGQCLPLAGGFNVGARPSPSEDLEIPVAWSKPSGELSVTSVFLRAAASAPPSVEP